MKKLLVTLGIIFLSYVLVNYIFERSQLNKTIDFKVLIIDEEEKSNFNLYVLNNEGLLEEIKVYIDFTANAPIEEIFKLYTSKSNTLLVGFYSPLVLSSKLLHYKVSDNVLIITVNNDFFRNITNESKSSLAWTFKQLNYDKVIFTNESTTIELNFDDYQILNNTLSTNLNTNIITIFYRHPNSFFPKSYECILTDEIDYIYYKLIDYFNIEKSTLKYDYQMSDERIYINLIDETNTIDELFIESFQRTILYNINKDVVIIKNSQIFS